MRAGSALGLHPEEMLTFLWKTVHCLICSIFSWQATSAAWTCCISASVSSFSWFVNRLLLSMTPLITGFTTPFKGPPRISYGASASKFNLMWNWPPLSKWGSPKMSFHLHQASGNAILTWMASWQEVNEIPYPTVTNRHWVNMDLLVSLLGEKGHNLFKLF